MRWWQIRKRNADLDRELQSDLELEEEEQQERGLSPNDARIAARRAIGWIPARRGRSYSPIVTAAAKGDAAFQRGGASSSLARARSMASCNFFCNRGRGGSSVR